MQDLLEQLDRAGTVTVWADRMTRADCQRLVDRAREQHDQVVSWETVYLPIPGFTTAEDAVCPAWRFTVQD